MTAHETSDTAPPRRIGVAARPAQASRSQAASFGNELLIVIVGAIIVSSLLRAFVGQMFIIPSQSMENTLLIGDRVVVQKITEFERGDVVVFTDPGSWLDESTAEPGRSTRLRIHRAADHGKPGHLIKREIGMPGDKVVCCDSRGRLTVNGHPWMRRPPVHRHDGAQVTRPTSVPGRGTQGPDLRDGRPSQPERRLPLPPLGPLGHPGKGQVAFVPMKLVVGPAFAIVAPFSRATDCTARPPSPTSRHRPNLPPTKR